MCKSGDAASVRTCLSPGGAVGSTITLGASIVALGLSVHAPAARGQSVATSTRATAQKTISRGRLDEVLGKSTASIRVVRTTGVSDLRPDASSVGIRPGDFLFRKMSDT